MVFTVDVAARFLVADLLAGAAAVALRPVAPVAGLLPCRGAADDARLATADLAPVDLLGVFLVVEASVRLRAAEAGATFFPIDALPATDVFFVAALAVVDLVVPRAAALLPTGFPATAFFAGFFADLLAPLLLADLRGLVVAMRVSLRMGADLPWRLAFDSTAAMQAK